MRAGEESAVDGADGFGRWEDPLLTPCIVLSSTACEENVGSVSAALSVVAPLCDSNERSGGGKLDKDGRCESLRDWGGGTRRADVEGALAP